ncbi:hypothetical protein [Helicobacter sp. 13S00477-4]|uniref:hypothetical protein n=1 Tax=Helicobacter sp. 13S00477-4 TaxID=1905759 RepID=UPI000BA6960A|nr:hypothetical protein [Helicobacter sp. 13S00477-4]PAF50318.1 hypothetical protein BKH44_08470 [Helicobacter sp. 13S00477-4]
MIEKYYALFSKNRIDSYSSIEEHNLNLSLIQELTKPIAIIELVVRNRINKIMQQIKEEWIHDLYRLLDEENQYLALRGHKSIIYRKLNEEINKLTTKK